ncbi:uncharacterized protein LOC62_04G005602 [Vanrija pseudolonga]|uniref:Uncharacterized protein n=1 Tax=Vanrija pseudolonga TaxID=143232 RepID=A0AAF0Y8K9_9TREE|nr:hypothetical protein LOC62_04G005602 [Vanrija pseudolonga]
MSAIAMAAAKKWAGPQIQARLEPDDPYYTYVVNSKGKRKRVKRDLPPGLTKEEEKILRKVRRRAHHLDKGFNLCGFKFGWTFFIGIIPGAGDIANGVLGYLLVVRPSTTLDLPPWLVAHMLFNNAVSFGIGVVPIVGDVAQAVWKANWRNSNALEDHLAIRGQKALDEQARTTGATAQAALASDLLHGTGAVVGADATVVQIGDPAKAPGSKQQRKGKWSAWFGGGKEGVVVDEEAELQSATGSTVALAPAAGAAGSSATAPAPAAKRAAAPPVAPAAAPAAAAPAPAPITAPTAAAVLAAAPPAEPKKGFFSRKK